MEKNPNFFLTNFSGSKLLFSYENSKIFIYDSNTFSLQFMCHLNGGALIKEKKPIFFNESLIIFFGFDRKIFLFNLFFKKIIISICMGTPIFDYNFSFFGQKYFFFKKKKFFSMLNFEMLSSFVVDKIIKKKNKFFIKKSSFSLKCSPREYGLKSFGKKKEKIFKKMRNFFSSSLIWQETTTNFFICFDLSSRRIISEICVVNFYRKLKIFISLNLPAADNQIELAKFSTKNKLKNIILKISNFYFNSHFILNFFHLSSETTLKKFHHFSNQKNILWHPFFFMFFKKNPKCLGLDIWQKKNFENWSFSGFSYREIDFTEEDRKYKYIFVWIFREIFDKILNFQI